uniref:Sugar transporter SWEET n=1 Tax=Rhabditophanes sp. KR3021 TaxID=114890 RepID=A0AC35U0K1_9BILA
MDWVDIFGIYIGLLGITLCLLPVLQIKEYIKRKSSDGYNEINYHTGPFITAIWLKYGLMSQIDNQNGFLAFMIFLSCIYSCFYCYYSSNKLSFIGKQLFLCVILITLFMYIDSLEFDEGVKTIGRIASASNSLRFVPAVTDIYKVFKTKTTEYIPANQTFMFGIILSQFFVHSLVTANYYRLITNVAGIATIIIIMALYVLYPPLTWRVPIIGTGIAAKSTEEKKIK